MLITKAEIITLAYNRKIDENQIKDAVIDSAEFKYIRQILTENFYDYVVANTSTFTTLIDDYIKPCLAYFVKYLAFNDFFVEISDRGAFNLNADNANVISNATRTDTEAKILQVANIKAEKLTDYIKKQDLANNTDYVLYNDMTDVQTEDEIVAGFFIEGVNKADYDYTIDL